MALSCTSLIMTTVYSKIEFRKRLWSTCPLVRSRWSVTSVSDPEVAVFGRNRPSHLPRLPWGECAPSR